MRRLLDDARGSGPLCTPRSKSSDLASAPIRGRSAPPTPGVYAGLAAPAPTCRRSARAWQSHARHPGDFPVAGKVTKGAPKPTVLDSLGVKLPPFSRSLTHRAGLPSATEKDRFATLSWWTNRSYFFLWFHRENTLCFQSVARQDASEDA